jgi:pimeloyl-ACP methyl ester carboxylesterase
VLLAMSALGAGGCRPNPSQADPASAAPSSPGVPVAEPTSMPVFFELTNGERFEGRLTAPATSAALGWGIVMIGGGVGNDLDWTTPGTLSHDGATTQFTLSGQSHADAPGLSLALAQRGFAVLRWSTIAVDDPLAEHWPLRATPRTQAQLLEQARAAIDLLRTTALHQTDRVILLAHSQGAARACAIMALDPDIAGLVALAPAYFTRHERHAATLASHGLCSCEEALLARPRPVLALFGALDSSRVVDADAAAMLAGNTRFDQIEVKVFSSLGHQLGEFRDGQHGPMDPQVIDNIAAWCEGIAREPE